MPAKTVAVALSGGVDSSACVILLKELGYDVVAITAKMGNDDKNNQLVQKAKTIADKLNVKHEVLDISTEFNFFVKDYFDFAYKKGETPNPCVMCNKFLKWGILYNYAIDDLNLDYFATGHYANIVNKDGKYLLYPAKDNKKDQLYYLFDVPNTYFSKTIFPLADYSKSEIVDIASKYGIISSSYKESQDICFINPPMTTKKYLKEKYGEIKGDFIEISSNKKLGSHDGYYQFTIGQRKGIGIAYSEPLYVIKIDAFKNIVYLGTKDKLFAKKIVVYNPILHDYKNCDRFEALIKIRYNMDFKKVLINKTQTEKGVLFDIELDEEISAITKGQAVVFYDINDKHLIGGAWI